MGRKVISMSYSSAILKIPPGGNFKMSIVIQNYGMDDTTISKTFAVSY